MRTLTRLFAYGFVLLSYAVLSFSSAQVEVSLEKLPTEPLLTEQLSTEQRTEKANADFLALHWQQPIQAILPTTTNEQVSATFTPNACAVCHPQKFDDWQHSLHADAMSVGVMVQLQMLSPKMLAKHYLNDKGCMHCHAPTQRQQQSLVNTLTSNVEHDAGNSAKNNLHQQGVICIACHVRDEHWFGPDTSVLKKLNTENSLRSRKHDLQRHSAFQSTQFCANCHQFKVDGPSLAGKLIQNTYNEWQASDFEKQGVSCQHCHMPNKRHLFKGIHDKEMVLSGLTITSELITKRKQIAAYLTVKNTGVGHHFPTYVTPRVILRAFQVTANGDMLEQSLLEYEIMRAVSLDLSDEYFDSRLAAGEEYRFDYQQSRVAGAEQLIFTITVEPDYFYQQFFTEMLSDKTINSVPQKSIVKSLKSAKDKTDNSPYQLFSKSFSLQ